MISYPPNLPCASRIEGHSAAISAGLIRTPMEAGNTRQRRTHRAMPHLISLTFVGSQLQLADWTTWCNAHAFDEWVVMKLPGLVAGRSETDTAPIPVRFCSDIQTELDPTHRLWYWRAHVDAEYLPTVEDLRPWTWFVAGGPATGAVDWILAGTPAAPSTPDWILAGTPAAPSSPID